MREGIGYVQHMSKLLKKSKYKSKPIQHRNSNLNYIQFPNLKMKRKKTKTKAITLLVMGTRPVSLMVADFSLSPISTPCLLCLPFYLGFGSIKSFFETFWFHRLSLSPCPHRLSLFHCLSLFLSWFAANFNQLFIMRGF